MMKSKLAINQTTLKFIAVLSMLIDHIGILFFDGIYIFRIIGRLAFPIFAFLIARSFLKTKNRWKFLLRLALFACISIYPYFLAFGSLRPNILFTFALSILLMIVFEKLRNSSFFQKNAMDKFIKYFLMVFTVFFFVIISEVFMFEYGFLGLLLPFGFWLLDEFNYEKYLFFIFLTSIYCLASLLQAVSVAALLQFFSLLAVPFLAITTSSQGTKTYKWFFYIFYPTHLTVLYLLSLIL